MRTVLLLSFIASVAAFAGCAVIEDPSAQTGAQGQPHGTSAPAHAEGHHAGHHPGHAQAGSEAALTDTRTRLLPLGYGNGAINVSTGLRTDPVGSEEGLLPTERLGTRGGEGAGNRLPLEASARGMWGSEGPGGSAGGSALPSEAPPTAPRPRAVEGPPAPSTKKPR